MHRVRIRSTILLVVCVVVDFCMIRMFADTYALVDCGTKETAVGNVKYRAFGTVAALPWGPVCLSNSGAMNPMVWNNEYQIERCKVDSWDGSSMQCKEYEDAGKAFEGAQGLAMLAIFFNSFVALAAFLELLGYTVGSKCQAAYVITGGVLTTVLAILAGLLCFTAGMTVGDKKVSIDFCNICYCDGASDCEGTAYDNGTIQDPSVGEAPMRAIFGGVFAIAEVVIGILMCAQINRDKEMPTSADDAGGL